MDFSSTLAIGLSAYEKGNYRLALDTFREMADAGAYADKDRRKADTMVEIGRCLRKLGHFAEAEKTLMQTKALFNFALESEETLELADVLEQLGLVYIDQSRFVEGEDMLEKALVIRKLLLSAEDALVGESLNDLGLLAWHLGDDLRAKRFWVEALEIRRRSLGELHPRFADTLDNLGTLHQRMGQLDEAQRCHSEALAIRENGLGAHHPDVGDSLLNLAEVYRRCGREAEVEQLLRRAIGIWEEALGPGHHYVAIATNNLAGYFLDRGELECAAPLFERAVEILTNVLGSDNPALATHLHNLSTLYKQQRKLDQARALDEKLESLLKEKIKTATGTQQLLLQAWSLQNEENYADAGVVLNQALTLVADEFGGGSLRAAQILEFLGTNSFKLRDVAGALDYFNRSLSIKDAEGSLDDVAALKQNVFFLASLQAELNKSRSDEAIPPSEETDSGTTDGIADGGGL